ncbi:MAG: lipopolysaccharide biosynthesis protein [Roseimicrobium sp.]
MAEWATEVAPNGTTVSLSHFLFRNVADACRDLGRVSFAALSALCHTVSMSLGKRFLQGAGLSFLEHGVRTASLFITTPLVVHWLGTEAYGYWLVAMSAMGYFAVLDLGVSFATTRFMAVAVGARDAQQQAVLHRVATTHFQRMSWIIALGSFGLFLVLPYVFADQFHLGRLSMLAATVPVGLTMALRFRCRLPQLLLRAWVRYDLLAWAAIIRVCLQSTALMVLLPRGGGLVTVGIIQALSDVLELLLQRWFSQRMPTQHHEAIVEGEASEKVKRDLIAFTRDITLGTLGDTIRFNAGPMVTGLVCGVGLVPIYSLGVRLITMLEDVVNALFGGGALSVFGQMHGAGESERMHQQFRRLLGITSGFCAASMGGLLFFGKDFMRRWMGEAFVPAFEVVQLLAVPYALFLMQYPTHSLLYTLGYQRPLMWVRCLGGAFAGVAGLFLGIAWGVRGVALGLALEMAICYTVVIPWLVHWATGVSAWRYLFGWVIWPGIKGLLFPALVGWALSGSIAPDYGLLLMGGLAYGVTILVSAPFCVLDGEGRALLRRAMGFK